jgi:flavodoxin
MKTLIAYYSRGGHTRKAAEAIAAALRARGHEAALKLATQLKPADVAQAEAVFVGTWVHGLILFGVRPAGLEEWGPRLPPLEGKPAGVFCTYMFHPHASLRTLAKLVEARGGAVKAQRAWQRERVTEGVDAFVAGVLGSNEPPP